MKNLTNIFHKYLNKDYINLLIIFVILSVLLSPSLIQHSMTWRVDAYFHLSRIHDLTLSIKDGHLPLLVNINSFGFLGQAINGMYPFFGWLPLIALTSIFPPILQYAVINYTFILFGSILNYFVFQKLGSSKQQALTAVIICLSFIDIYNFAVFSLQGAWSTYFIIPLVFLCLKEINQGKRIYIFPLAFSISFAINIHLISAALFIVFTAIVGCIFLVKSKYKLIVVRYYLYTVGLVILLSLFTIISITSFLSSHPSTPKIENITLNTLLNAKSMLLTFINPSIYQVITDPLQSEISPLQGLILLVDILLVFSWKRFQTKAHYLITTIISLQIFISPFFPWKLIKNTFIVSVLQFPLRLAPFILILSVILFMTEKGFNKRKFLLLFCLFSIGFAITYQLNDITIKKQEQNIHLNQLNFIQGQNLISAYKNSTKVDNIVLNDNNFYRQATYQDYIPTNDGNKTDLSLNEESLINHDIYLNNSLVQDALIKNTRAQISYTLPNTVSGTLDLPIWKYKNMNYQISDQNNKTLTAEASTRNSIKVDVQDAKRITVKVHNPHWYTPVFIITSLAWISTIIIFLYYYISLKRQF